MTRLTIVLKSKIINNAVKAAGIPERKEELRKRIADWIERVRVESLGGAEKVKKINSIEKRFNKAISDISKSIASGIFRKDSYMYVKALGNTSMYYFFGAYSSKSEEKINRVCPYSYVIDARDPLSDELLKIESFRDYITDEEDNIRANVRGALDKITTVKKLLAVWPEAVELLPGDLSPKPKDQLPMVQTKDLNKIIGLPTGKKK